MKRPSRPPIKMREIAILGALAVAAAAVLAALLWADIQWSSVATGGGSFYSMWMGAREVLFGQDDPYSAEVAVAVQRLVYGGPAPFGANPYWLDLPLFLMPLLFPLGAVAEGTVARGLWMLLGQLAIAAAMLLSLHLTEWRAPRSSIIFLGLFGALSAHSVLTLQEGTPTVMLTLGYVACLWALQAQQDELAGALISLCLFKWEVGLPLLLLIIWYVFHERRWRCLAGAGMTLSILLAVSFFLRPAWPLPFLTAVVAMIRSPHGVSVPAALLRLWPTHGSELAWALMVLLIAILIFEWAIGREAGFRRFLWLAFLAISVTPLLGMRSELTNLTPLLPAYAFIAAATLQRRRVGMWIGLLFLSVAFIVPWFLLVNAAVAPGQRIQDLLFLFLPLLTTLGLYWTRWWLLRPARTWLDEVKAVRT